MSNRIEMEHEDGRKISFPSDRVSAMRACGWKVVPENLETVDQLDAEEKAGDKIVDEAPEVVDEIPAEIIHPEIQTDSNASDEE